MTQLNVHLKDGSPVLLRPVRPEDRQRLENGLQRISARSRYQRFLSLIVRLSDKQLGYFTEVDQENHVAWIALDSAVAGLPGLGITLST